MTEQDVSDQYDAPQGDSPETTEPTESTDLESTEVDSARTEDPELAEEQLAANRVLEAEAESEEGRDPALRARRADRPPADEHAPAEPVTLLESPAPLPEP